jgi:hypothetical protein
MLRLQRDHPPAEPEGVVAELGPGPVLPGGGGPAEGPQQQLTEIRLLSYVVYEVRSKEDVPAEPVVGVLELAGVPKSGLDERRPSRPSCRVPWTGS